MEVRGQFTFYRSFYESLKNLPAEIAYPVFMAICAYALDGTEIELDVVPSSLFSLIRPNLDSSRKKATGGKTGGVPQADVKQLGGVTQTSVKKPGGVTKANAKQPDNIPARYVEDVDKIRTRYAEDTDKMQGRYAEDTGKIRGRCVEDTGKIHGRYAEDAVKIHGRYAEDTGNKKEKEIEKEIEIEYESTPKPPKGDFEEFWSAFPKKVGKQAAKKAFEKVKVPLETLLTAIEQQKRSAQWSKDNGQFIPNPATWLNQGRWDDEMPPAGKYTTGNPVVANKDNFVDADDVEYLNRLFESLEDGGEE